MQLHPPHRCPEQLWTYYPSVYCIVVKRGEFKRFDALHRVFCAVTPVVWDRRKGNRRVRAMPFEGGDRRGSERRVASPPSWQALSFVVVDKRAC